MSVHETGPFSLTQFIEEAGRLDEALPSPPAEKTADRSIMTVTVAVKTSRTNSTVVSVVGYKRRSKRFVNTPLLRLVVVPATEPGEKQFGGIGG
jgi:hypothetical protein